MADREKVTRELKAARLFFEMGSNRADGVVGNLGCKSGMKYIDDALELLKEQEPVAPGLEQDGDGIYSTCGNCKTRLWKLLGVEFEINPDAMPKFCPQCGKEVKWK